MALIPVVLRLSAIAKNYNLCFGLTTPGVVWSLGGDGADYLGISFNALTLENQHSCNIQRIEYTGSILTICTGPSAGSDFVLTACIDVPEDIAWLQGYCIANEGARVFARLGDLAPVEWRDEINCEIPILLPDIHRATFTIRGVKQGHHIRIHLASDDSKHDDVRWCSAPIDNPNVGLTIRSAQDGVALPIVQFSLDAKNIDLTIGSAKASGGGEDVVVEAYIQRMSQCRYCPPMKDVRIKAECDGFVEVTAQLGQHRPQALGRAYRLFAL